MNPRIARFVLAAGVVLPAGCGDSPVDPPDGTPTSVHAISVQPASAFLDPGDSIQLSAVARDAQGTIIAGAALTWRSLSSNATVDGSGRVTGVQPGEARIEAAASNGVSGTATVRVTPIETMSPDSGRYGQVVTLTGSNLPQNGTVYFSGSGGERVRARTRSTSPTELEVWVPVHAREGPLQLISPGDSVVTSRVFRVTADEDVYSAGEDYFEIPFPFENPSLLARSGDTHRLSFEVDEPTPFSLVLEDAGDPGAGTTVRTWLFRQDPGPVTLISFLLTRDYLDGGAVLDRAVYARESLAPGRYVLLVAAMDLDDPEATGVRRPFGIRLEAEASHAVTPDAFDPNDFPEEAPLVEVPFAATDLRAENGHAMDHFAIEVTEASTLTATTSAADPWILMSLFADGPADVLAAWDADAVVAENEGSTPVGQIQATVPAGRYHLLVWEWGGRARGYDLEIAATPASAADPAAPRSVPLDDSSFLRRMMSPPGEAVLPGIHRGGRR